MAETVWKCPHLEKYFIFSLFFDVFGVLFLGDSSSRENFMEDGYTTHWEEVEIPCSPLLRVSSCVRPVSERLRLDFRFSSGWNAFPAESKCD